MLSVYCQFGLKRAKSEQAKWKHLQPGSMKSMCTPISWSRWGPIGGLLGSFGSIWVGDSVPGRIQGTLNFGVLQVKKFKFGSTENLGYGCRIGSVSEKVQIFGERSIFMKCSLLYGGLNSSIWFLFLKIFIWFLGGAKVGLKSHF